MIAQVGRADVLRALHLGRSGALALEHNDALWWGFVPTEQERRHADAWVIDAPGVPATHRTEDGVPSAAPRARSALRMPEVWVAERIGPTDGADRADSEADAHDDTGSEERRSLRTEDVLRQVQPVVGYQDLVPLPRLVRPLQKQLLQSRSGGVHLPALLRAASCRRWPRVLPRSTRRVWPQRLVVLLDFTVALFPYRYDMYRVAELLQALVPKAQLQLMVGQEGPFGDWEPLDADAYSQPADSPLQPVAGHAYLIVSDLGLLRGTTIVAAQWRTWLMQAKERQCPSVALAPVASDDIDVGLAGLARLLRWSPDSRWHPQRGRRALEDAHERKDRPRALQELLQCLAATLRMDPPLLRALRQHGSATQDASLEGRLWSHPEVHATSHATLRDGAAPTAVSTSPHIPSALWEAMHHLARQHHQHWPLTMRVADQVQQIAMLPDAPAALVWKTSLALRELAEAVQADTGDRPVLVEAAGYILRRAPDEARRLLGSALDALANAVGRPVGPRRPWCLLQRGEDLYIASAGDARPAGPGMVLCGDIGQAAPGELVRISQPLGLPRYETLPTEGMLSLAALLPRSVVTLGGAETELTRVQRTRGVWGWSQRDGRVFETFDLPMGVYAQDFLMDHGRYVSWHVRGQASGDLDIRIRRDAYGVLLELQSAALVAKGYPSDRPLRFRYLEPATFLQGSPEGIGYPNERPHHPVNLTKGLWLAETPCTQALWIAVMGKNPSRFKQGEEAPWRPVESVSWGVVTAFLQGLQRFLPSGLEAVLPTESQWEYACRAGSQTQYWWGDVPEDSRANWNQQHDGTTTVHRYAPNPWGFYDMHGNVWEWCRDGMREYAAEIMLDPEGPDTGTRRQLRGGSCADRHDVARAAYRFSGHRSSAYLDRGFRVAIKSSGGLEKHAGDQNLRRVRAVVSRVDRAEHSSVTQSRRARNDTASHHNEDKIE